MFKSSLVGQKVARLDVHLPKIGCGVQVGQILRKPEEVCERTLVPWSIFACSSAHPGIERAIGMAEISNGYEGDRQPFRSDDCNQLPTIENGIRKVQDCAQFILLIESGRDALISVKILQNSLILDADHDFFARLLFVGVATRFHSNQVRDAVIILGISTGVLCSHESVANRLLFHNVPSLDLAIG